MRRIGIGRFRCAALLSDMVVLFDVNNLYSWSWWASYKWKTVRSIVVESQVVDKRPVNNPVPGRSY